MIRLFSIFSLSVSLLCSCQKSLYNAVETNFINADFKILYTTNTASEFTKSFEDPFDNSIIYVDTVNVICDQKNLKKIWTDFNNEGMPMIGIELDEKGTQKFSEASEMSMGKKLAVVNNDRIIIAPKITEKVSKGIIQISGHYTWEEIKKLKKEIINNNQATK